MGGAVKPGIGLGSLVAMSSSMNLVCSKLSLSTIIKWNDLSFLSDRNSS